VNKPVDIVTFGCRLNAWESEVMRSQADAAGLDGAVVVNTCAVTAEAQRQARQAIRKARKHNPNARIIVTGCAAQTDADAFAQMPEVDLVLGNEEKLKPESWRDGVKARRDGEAAPVKVADIMQVTRAQSPRINGFGEKTRAVVQVQTGCDHRCTFCIIPFGRGNSRSVAPADAVAQVRSLVEAGCPEIVLSGVDITSWGKDLAGEPQLGSLVRRILNEVPDLKRLRISSIDSVEADDELLAAIGEEDRLMPHLHLSLQAGDNMVLKRMKRRHSREDAIAFCEEVRRRRPDVVFGADIIAGFPTETDEMFENSMRLVDECGLTFLHVFPYSKRPGTPAAKMPQVDGAAIKERAKRLREAGEARLSAFVEGLAGSEQEVLFETATRGRTRQYVPVNVDGGAVEPGSMARVRITRADAGELGGDLIV
jgi:threonylcarbamoyladenosine tRNA methylthiotransferase MtaB